MKSEAKNIMTITDLTVNHLTDPIGYHMDSVSFRWLIRGSSGKKAASSRLRIAADKEMENILYDSGDMPGDLSGITVDYAWEPSTRYYWDVSLTDDLGETAASGTAYFETPKSEKEWVAKWITGTRDENNTLLVFRFTPKGKVTRARLSVTGLGLYEAYINKEKIGDEYLTPNFNDYNNFIQFQTYDTGSYIRKGENELTIWLGNGWYMGRYISFGPTDRNLFGDNQAAIAELHLNYADGTGEIIATNESWKCRKSPVLSAEIYDGEILDDTVMSESASDTESPVKVIDLGCDRLEARRSSPVKTMIRRKPAAVIRSPRDEMILDFGQNMAGWVSFRSRLPKGAECRYVTGEILQDGCFYHENMRTARTEFVYVSDGVEKWVRPHFTFYGFRYLLLEGFGKDIDPDDFEAEVFYSEMEQTGFLESGNTKVNQLISNVLWGQRSNFIDIPTDCPQRDERMGWTGDTQIFSRTAMYNMNSVNFFRKHMCDIYREQQAMGGRVPFVVPLITFGDQVSAGWSDAATIIPWNLYLMYGDKETLREEYPGMKAWADFIYSRDVAGGKTGLWHVDNHFGDWLSLDASEGVSTGGTDITLIATAFYYHSTRLTALAAKALGFKKDAALYADRAGKIRTAFQSEYLTENGRPTEHTQTACALTLYMGLYREGQQERLADELEGLILKNSGHLDTGFIGTPYLCPALSKFGKNELAYELLLNEDYPGWLYSVNLGGTTLWERWNSVLPDGHMNPEGMNSLNHYAYGAILEWMYMYAAGITPLEPGWKKISFAPMPSRKIDRLCASYDSISGTIVSEWEYMQDGTIRYCFEVPFGTTAVITLPDEEPITVDAGAYAFTRQAASAGKGYSGYTDVAVLCADEDAKEIITKYAPGLLMIPAEFAHGSLADQMLSVFSGYTAMDYENLVEEIKKL